MLLGCDRGNMNQNIVFLRVIKNILQINLQNNKENRQNKNTLMIIWNLKKKTLVVYKK